MTILEPDAADDDLKHVKPAAEFAGGPTKYPYLALVAEDFERLNYALFKSSAPQEADHSWTSATLLIRGADAGRDILLIRDGHYIGLVQCKRLETTMALPEVVREIAKVILFPNVQKDLPTIEAGHLYYLALASDPTSTVVDFFSRPQELLEQRKAEVDVWVSEVLEKYKSLAPLDKSTAIEQVKTVARTLRYRLVRPVDFDLWLETSKEIAPLFFKHRVLVDNEQVKAFQEQVSAAMATIQAQLSGVPLLTDADLKVIKERIDGVPETHRLTVGFASIFGIPQEMFAGDENFRKHVQKLAAMMSEFTNGYIDWLFEKSGGEAERLCNLPQVRATVPFLARQIPLSFLGEVVRDASWGNIIGKVLGNIVVGANQAPPVLASDEDRLSKVRETLVASAKRYLNADFSELVSDVAFKRRIISHMMQDIRSEQDIQNAFEQGINTLRPHLYEAADKLRALCKYKPSVFLLGSSGIDSATLLDQMVKSVQALELLKNKGA